jgi:alkylation response protein AidB-like acyl-CoA dehydrogenase
MAIRTGWPRSRSTFRPGDVTYAALPAGLERALRDARLGPIGGGTDEIMKEILGRSLGL